MTEWIFDTLMEHMPRTTEMRDMAIPEHARARLKAGDMLKCEMVGASRRWFINDVECFEGDQYRCAECWEVFDKGRSDEEAMEEAVANGFGNVPAAEMAVICDDCYNAIVERNRNDPGSHFYKAP